MRELMGKKSSSIAKEINVCVRMRNCLNCLLYCSVCVIRDSVRLGANGSLKCLLLYKLDCA